MKDVPFGRLPRALEDYYRVLNYTAVLPYAWYAARSAREAGTLANEAAAWHRDLCARIRATGDEALAAQEADSTERLLCDWRWKGFTPFDISDGAYTFRNASQAAGLERAIVDVSTRVLTALRELVEGATAERVRSEASYPVNKGKSAPFYVPGTNRAAAPALAAITNSCESFDEIQALCGHLGATNPICVTLYTRIQAAKSPRTLWAVDADGARVEAGQALLCKVRKVQAVGFVMNYAYAVLGSVLTEAARVAGIGLLPRLDQVQEATKGVDPQAIFGEDISNYDDSVGSELYRLVTTNLILPACEILLEHGILTHREASLIASIENVLPTMQLLAPPRSRRYAAALLRREGGIVSGERLTSLKGTVINAARARAVLADAAVKPATVWTFGDDTLIVFERPEDAVMFASYLDASDAAALYGFKSTRADDATFLMRRVPQGYGYVGRMLMSTLQKEHTHEARTVPIAALGLAARLQNLRGHPFAQEFEELLFTPRVVGRMVTAAAELGRELGWDVTKLGTQVMAGVGANATGGATAHTEGEIADLLSSLSYSGDGTALGTMLAEIEKRSEPSVTAIDEAAARFMTGRGRIDKTAFRAAIGG